MRKRFFSICLAAATVLTAGLAGFSSLGATEQVGVDTLVLETEAASQEDVPVDIGWKTEQDNGKWIEDMGIADDASSLILVINNLDKTNGIRLPAAEEELQRKMNQRAPLAGNSRLIYLSKTEDGGWQENFSVNCFISGGQEMAPADIYGAYRLESAFGSMEDPGSLVPYHVLTDQDYWVTDPDDEKFGQLYQAKKNETVPKQYVNLLERKAFSNYGMVLKPETEGSAYPALVVDCQQASTYDGTFAGIQLSESYVRMLIQSIDEGTRILIAGEVEDLEGL